MSDNPMARYVEVVGPYTWDYCDEPAQVAWCEALPVSPEKARQFAAALLEAADKADALNKERK